MVNICPLFRQQRIHFTSNSYFNRVYEGDGRVLQDLAEADGLGTRREAVHDQRRGFPVQVEGGAEGRGEKRISHEDLGVAVLQLASDFLCGIERLVFT